MNETEMEISDMVDEDLLEELFGYFERNSARALKGALIRVNVI